VHDIVCTAGPLDRPFEEMHRGMCIAAVTQGTFQYRTRQGSAVLAPGAVLLGNDRQCFQCRHEHAAGDRCLSFHFTVEFCEAVAASIPGAPRPDFTVPRLPPLPALAPTLAAAEAARENGEAARFEELALRIAGVVYTAACAQTVSPRAPSQRDVRRIGDAVHRILAADEDALPLQELAREAAMSPYHFLRTFRAVVGMTPHQFLLHTRLNRAAVRLRTTKESISAIAFAAGFNDLSTFNHRFRRVIGVSPQRYRRAAGNGAA